MVSLTIGDSASHENLFSSHKIENILRKREILMFRRLSKSVVIGQYTVGIRLALPIVDPLTTKVKTVCTKKHSSRMRTQRASLAITRCHS